MIASSPDTDRATWLTVQEAAAYAKVHPNLIYQNIKLGRLRASRLGYRKDIRIRENWLEEWMVSRSTPHDIVPEPTAGPLTFNRHGRKRR